MLTNHARIYGNFEALNGVSLNAENSLSRSLDKRYYILAGIFELSVDSAVTLEEERNQGDLI